MPGSNMRRTRKAGRNADRLVGQYQRYRPTGGQIDPTEKLVPNRAERRAAARGRDYARL